MSQNRLESKYSHRDRVFHFPYKDDEQILLLELGAAWSNERPCGCMLLTPEEAKEISQQLTDLGIRVIEVSSLRDMDLTAMALRVWQHLDCDAVMFKELGKSNRQIIVSLPELDKADALLCSRWS